MRYAQETFACVCFAVFVGYSIFAFIHALTHRDPL